MSHASDFLVRRAMSAHQAALRAWPGRVQQAHSLEAALQMAAHPPAAPALIAALRGLTNRDLHQARTRIEADLKRRLDAVAADDPKCPAYLRMLAGHWPVLYRHLETRMQAERNRAP